MGRPKRFSLAWFAIAGIIFTVVSMLLSLIHPIFELLIAVAFVGALILSLPLSPLRMFFGKSLIDPFSMIDIPRVVGGVGIAALLVGGVFFVSLFFTRQFIAQCVAALPLYIFSWDLLMYWERSLPTEYERHS